jgi:hypothetical protein
MAMQKVIVFCIFVVSHGVAFMGWVCSTYKAWLEQQIVSEMS